MNNTKEIKSSLPIVKLIENYGGIKTATNQYWCIWHEKGGNSSGHKTASLVVHPDSQTVTCKSQGCFEGANIFAVIAKMDGLDIKSEYPKIIEKAASVAGIQIQKPIRKRIMTGSLQESHIEFLKNRGLEDETIAKMRLGGFYDHVQFKYFDNGEIVGYKAKTIIPKDKQSEHSMDNLKWKPYYIKGKKPDYWFIDGLQNKKTIYLVAGEYDLAILQQEISKKNISNDIGVMTLITGESSPISKSGLEYLRQLDNAEYRIIYDYDDTGLKNMPLRGQELIRTGKRVMAFSWKPEMNPDNKSGYDINDYFLANKNIDLFLDEANFSEVKNELEPIQVNDAEKIELTNDPVTLDDIYESLSKIGVVSHDVVEICLATCISVGLKLELPIWLMIIGNPSSFKTELLKLFRGIQVALYLSSMSENAFASGYIPTDGSKPKDLLSILNEKILLIRDLTTMFSLNEETVKKILGDLTSIFDGEFEKFTATRGLIKYRATFPIIACITPAILAKHQHYMNQLGSRFLFFRIPNLTDKNREMGYRIAWNKEERSVNIKKATVLVSSFCTQIINSAKDKKPPTIDGEVQDWLNRAAEFISRARGTVITQAAKFKDEKGEEVTYYEVMDTQIEEPWRALLQLRSLVIALAVIRGKDVVTLDECEILRTLIQSSAPIHRSEVMVALMDETGITAKQLSEKIGKTARTIRRNLKELEVLGLVIKFQNPEIASPPWQFGIEPQFSLFIKKDYSVSNVQEFIAENNETAEHIPSNLLDQLFKSRDINYEGGGEI